MLCPNCGESNHESRSSCWRCHAPLTGQDSLTPASVTATHRTQPRRRRVGQDLSDGEKVGMMAAAVLLPVAGLVWGIVYACSPEAPRKQWGGYAIAASSVCIVLGFIIAMAIAAATGDAMLESTPDITELVAEPSASSGAPVTSRPDPVSQVQMLDWSFKTDIISVDPPICNQIIEGDALNNSGLTISYAQVEFNLYDSSDRQVGTAFDNVTNWEPGSTWHFEALVMEDSATKARFKGFTVW